MAEEKFEVAMGKLEAIVEGLESGDHGLDAMLKNYEDGVKLAAHCSKILSQAEKKIEVLSKTVAGDLVVDEIDSLDDVHSPKKKTVKKKRT